MDDVADKIFADAGEEGEDDDIVIETVMRNHRLVPVGLKHTVVIIGNVYSCLNQVWVVERFEGVELFGALFGGTVTTKQVSAKIDSYFRH